MDCKAQVSIEIILVLAAIVAFVLLFVSRLFDTGQKAADTFQGKADDVLSAIKKLK